MRSVMITLRVISLPDLVAMGYELGNIHNLEQAEKYGMWVGGGGTSSIVSL